MVQDPDKKYAPKQGMRGHNGWGHVFAFYLSFRLSQNISIYSIPSYRLISVTELYKMFKDNE